MSVEVPCHTKIDLTIELFYLKVELPQAVQVSLRSLST